MDKKEIMQIPIEELSFSVRTYAILKKANPSINNVEELLDLENLLKIENIGSKSIKEIYEKLMELKGVKETVDYEKIGEKLKKYRMEEKSKKEKKERMKVSLNPCRACHEEKVYLTCSLMERDICKSCCIKIQLNIYEDHLKDILKGKDEAFILSKCLDCMGIREKYNGNSNSEAIRKIEEIFKSYKIKYPKIMMYKFFYSSLEEKGKGYFVFANSLEKALTKYFKTAENLDIPKEEIYFNIGESLKENPKEAIKYYRKSYEFMPSPETGKRMGDSFMQLRDDKEAIKWYKQSMSLDPRVYLNISICYKRLSKMSQNQNERIENLKLAKKYYLKTKPMYGDSKYLYFRCLGDLCREIAILEDAYEYFEKAANYYEASIKVNDEKLDFKYEYDHVLERYSLAFCYMKLRKYEKAIQYAKEYINYHPHESVEDIGVVDKSFVLIGDTEEIIERTALMNMIIAKCYYHMHQLDKAYEHMKRAMYFKPEDKEIIDFCDLIIKERMYENYKDLSQNIHHIDERIEDKLNDYMCIFMENLENKNIHLEKQLEKVHEEINHIKENQTHLYEKIHGIFSKMRDSLGNIEENIEAFAKDLHHIFDQEGYYELIPWAEGDKLLKAYLGEKIYDEISKYEEVIKPLKTAEWVWHNNIENIKNQLRDEQIKDLTFLVVLHFKAIEIYLFEKTFELGWGKEILLLKGEKVEICQTHKSYIRENSTIGNYYHFIKNNAEIMLKEPKRKFEVFYYIKEWAEHCRNSNLHKDIIESIHDVQKKRLETKKILENLVKDLKCL